jgi:hypothetical protein
MIFSSSFMTTSFLHEDYGLRFHNIIGFFYDDTYKNIQNSMILKMDYIDRDMFLRDSKRSDLTSPKKSLLLMDF